MPSLITARASGLTQGQGVKQMVNRNKNRSTYTRAVDGGHEYGLVVYGADRRRDKMVPVGVAPTFEAADAARDALVTES